jgi:hypothetical protein
MLDRSVAITWFTSVDGEKWRTNTRFIPLLTPMALSSSKGCTLSDFETLNCERIKSMLDLEAETRTLPLDESACFIDNPSYAEDVNLTITSPLTNSGFPKAEFWA